MIGALAGEGSSARNTFLGLARTLILYSIFVGCVARVSLGYEPQPQPAIGSQAPWTPVPAEMIVGVDEFAATSPYLCKSQIDPFAYPSLPPTLSSEWRWKFLPQGFLYHTYWASTAEPRLSTRAVKDLGGHSSLDSQVGGRFGIVRYGNPDAEEGFQIDLLAGANLRQNLDTSDLDMTGTDYRYDIPLTYRLGPHAWKFGFYHVSSHMGDEFLQHNPSASRIDYYRDSLYLGYSYFIIPELRLYGELDYAFSRDYSEPWHIQFGFDWGPVRPTGIRGAPFMALNVHLRQELDFGGNVSMQAGWAWKGEGLAAGTLRTGLHYYNGGSPQYSFYRESEQQIGWGLWYDY